MQKENVILATTVDAAADLRTKRWYAVGADGNLAGAGEGGVGILQNTPNTGQAASVAVVGMCNAVYGGTIAVDDDLTTDANGKVVAITNPSSQKKIAKALYAGSADEIHGVLLDPGQGGYTTAMTGVSTGAGDVAVTAAQMLGLQRIEVATGHAANAIILPTGSAYAGRSITVVNGDGAAAVLIKVAGGTAVTVALSKTAMVQYNAAGTEVTRITADV